MQRQRLRGGQTPPPYRAAGCIVLAAHLLLVGWLTLRPLDVPWVGPANLHPLAGIRADLGLGPRVATRRIGAGLLLLAPLGVLLPLVGGRLTVSPLGSLVRTVAAAALLSLGIELLQTGVPGQVVDVDALLLNPLGVALTHLGVVPAARARLRRRMRENERLAPPGRTPWCPHRTAPVPSPIRASRPEAATVVSGDAAQQTTPTISRVGIAP